MEGTLRCYDAALMQTMRERLLAHLRGVEEAWGVSAEFREMSAVPPVMNDAGLARLAYELFPEACVEAEKLMVAEDFCRYGERVPALMGFLGCRNEEKGFSAPLHAPAFGFDENALMWGLEFYKRLFVS
jgi:hippurate hydrolase